MSLSLDPSAAQVGLSTVDQIKTNLGPEFAKMHLETSIMK